MKTIFTIIMMTMVLTVGFAQSGIQSVTVQTNLLAEVVVDHTGVSETDVTEIASVGTQIKKAREARGITKQQLANFSGLSLENIENIEQDKAYPTREILAQIQEHLSVELILDAGL